MNPRKNNPFLRISTKLLPLSLGLAVAAPLCLTSAFAADGTWAQASPSGNWSDASKWVGGTIANIADGIGAIGNFNENYGTGNKIITIDTTSRTLGTLNIGDPGTQYRTVTIDASGGASLTFDNGGAGALLSKATATNNVTDRISAPVILADNLTIHNSDTTTNSNLVVSGPISESLLGRGITKTGAGNAEIGAATTYTGTTTIEQGELSVSGSASFTQPISLGNANSISNNYNVALNMGGTISFTGDVIVGASNSATSGTYRIGTGNANSSASFSGAVTLNQNLTVSSIGNGGGTFTVGGTITSASAGTQTVTFNTVKVNGTANTVSSVIGGGTGTIAVTKIGTGTTILTGANTYTGATTISTGVLQIGDGGTTGSISPSSQITSDATLAFNRSDTVTQGTDFDSVIEGAGGVRQAGTGTLVLNGTNTYSGGTAVNAGTLSLSTNGTLGTGPLVVQNLNALAATDVALNLATGMDTTVGSLSGTIAAATPADPPNTATINTASGRDFIVNQSAELAYNGVIAGDGNFTLGSLSTSILSLNGANTYTGTTTIESGTLLAGNDYAFGDSTSAIALGSATSIANDLSSALNVNGAHTLSRDITVGASNAATTGTYTIGTGNVNSSSTIEGTVTLNQDLTVSAVNQAGGTFTLAGSVTSGSTGTQTLTFNHTNNLDALTEISDGVGTIAVTKIGAGTTTLSSDNTYTGATAVDNGTLFLLGGSLTSDVTVADGASLGFDVAFPSSTTGSVTFDAGSTVRVDGTPAATTLMTAASFGGVVPTLDPAIPGWALEVVGTNLNLVVDSDYDAWAAIYDPADLTDMAGDNDNDGLTNQEEYAFGLSPVSGSSVNPITAQLDKGTGTFTYQRRDDALTGLTYKIWYSTDLATWTEDTTADQDDSAGPDGNGVEPVVVTLTTPPTDTKFFVRVSAE